MMYEVSMLMVVFNLLHVLRVSWTARSSQSALMVEGSKMLTENCSGKRKSNGLLLWKLLQQEFP